MVSSRVHSAVLLACLAMAVIASRCIADEEAFNFAILVPDQSTLTDILGYAEDTTCSDSTQNYLDFGNRRFYCRVLNGKAVVITATGDGTTNAAIATEMVLTLFQSVNTVVHYGQAGSPSLNNQLGDIVVADAVAHTGILYWQNIHSNKEKGVANLTFSDFTITIEPRIYPAPCQNLRNKLNRVWYRKAQVIASSSESEEYFWVNTAQSEAAAEVELEECGGDKCLGYRPKVITGKRGCSADIYVENSAYAEFLKSTLRCDTVDTATAAAALVCVRKNVPLVSVKTVSNYAGQSAGENVDREALRAVRVPNAAAVLKAVVGSSVSISSI
eukprot:TRINITY_DN24628_c0_g1_i1.p1 TRINITY_DN24628_c0_g1~~TRINITY_DN24628_c0_g1_i1.p1  ORF type:complete len:329 (-),score=29.89 TRINITY_DN24628_c0_g1_i1:252-1238(-)